MRTLRIKLASLLAVAALAAPSAPAVAAVSHAFTPAVGINPHVVLATRGKDVQFSCQTRVLDDPSGNPACYDPDTIQKAYGFSSLYSKGITGKGRTIVIVDAFTNPYIDLDLQLFDDAFGLPAATLTKISMPGTPAFDLTDAGQVGWSGESSLDVQWAHAIAPGASIILLSAASDNDADINDALKYAVDHNLGDVISMSFGEGEACMDPKLLRQQHRIFEAADRKNITLIASSGDDGAGQGTQGPDACDFGGDLFKAASTPASDPLVTGVGGTNLLAQDPAAGDAGYEGERAWADGFSGCPAPDQGCSGGGFSTLFDRPFYQFGVPNTNPRHRGVPDVSYDGGVDGGVLTHWGAGLAAFYGLDPATPAFFIFGGTSAGSPQWAGLAALADQAGHHRVGAINPALYALSHSKALYKAAFHDVTTGTNDIEDGGDGTTINGFDASTGWDAVTGLGTPKANFLVPYLALVSH